MEKKYFVTIPSIIKEKIVECNNEDNCVEFSEQEYQQLVKAICGDAIWYALIKKDIMPEYIEK